MKRDIMLKWVAALRSGKFQQGRRKLVQTAPNGQKLHCCLGALCAISPWKNTYDRMSWGSTNNKVLPEKIRRWAGMASSTGEMTLGTGRITTALSMMNDRRCFSFDEIADSIETNWEEL